MYNEYNVLKIIYINKVMKMNDYNKCGCVVLMVFFGSCYCIFIYWNDIR